MFRSSSREKDKLVHNPLSLGAHCHFGNSSVYKFRFIVRRLFVCVDELIAQTTFEKKV